MSSKTKEFHKIVGFNALHNYCTCAIAIGAPVLPEFILLNSQQVIVLRKLCLYRQIPFISFSGLLLLGVFFCLFLRKEAA